LLVDIAEAEAKCDQRKRDQPEGPVGPIQNHTSYLPHFPHSRIERTQRPPLAPARGLLIAVEARRQARPGGGRVEAPSEEEATNPARCRPAQLVEKWWTISSRRCSRPLLEMTGLHSPLGRRKPMKAVNVLDHRVGERLRSRRLKMGLSQSELGAAAGSRFSRCRNRKRGPIGSVPAA
jgi:hypothetical protein